MKNILRTAVIAGVTALSTVAATPASAEGAGHFRGTATIGCFGCGPSTCTATLRFNGYYNGYVVVDGGATASCTLNEPAGTCPFTGTATGTVTGAVNVSFVWSRVGAVAVISTTGDIDGSGAAVFAVTSPVGNPCGSRNVVADFQGAIAGT